MKKTVLLPLIFQCFGLFAQHFYPAVYRPPITGFELLMEDNPIIIEMEPSGSTGENWIPSQRFLRFKDPVLPYTEEDRVSRWENNTWTDNQLSVNSFILDNQNRLQTVYSVSKYSFSGTEWNEKSKFDFAYNNNNQLIQIDYSRAEPDTSDNYVKASVTYVKYDANGKRIIDSSFYTTAGPIPYVSRFQYTNDKLSLTQQYSGDELTARDAYTYNGDLLVSLVGEYFNSETDEWTITNIDSFEYDTANNISRRVDYGMMFVDGEVLFGALRNESFLYNTNNKLKQIIERYSVDDEWVNYAKTEITYASNGKAEVGYQYQFFEGEWNSSASLKYHFGLLTGVKQIASHLSNIQLFPNPANNLLTVNLENNQGSITLFNALGKRCLEKHLTSGEHTIDVSTFDNGMYYAVIENGSLKQTQKIIIQH